METSANNSLEFAVLQAVAECYLDGVDLDTGANNAALEARLRSGNNHYNYDSAETGGRTRLTNQQIKWFFENFDIVDHYQNDASGFSATVFLNRETKEHTLSIRSTEYANEDRGGDWLRDGMGGAGGEINTAAVALTQTASMERYFENLRHGRRFDSLTGQWIADEKVSGLSQALAGGAVINVTGYSLGGHLANVLTVLHQDVVRKTYLFNAAGLGSIDGLDPSSAGYAAALREKLAVYDAVMLAGSESLDQMVLSGEIIPGVVLTSQERSDLSFAISSDRKNAPDPNRVYSSVVHGWLVDYLRTSMIGAGAGTLLDMPGAMRGLAISQLLDKIRNYLSSRDEFGDRIPDAFDTELYEFSSVKISSVYGKGVFFDPELVANTGYHPEAHAFYIEDQPMARGLGGLKFLPGAFGETHSITLLIDSLTVLDLLQGLDRNLTSDVYRTIESSIANSVRTVADRTPKTAAFLGALGIAQGFAASYGDEAAVVAAKANSFELKDADALERTIKAVGNLLGVNLSQYDLTPSLVGGGFADLIKRNQLHDAIAALKGSEAYQSLKENALFVPLTGMTADEIFIGVRAEGKEGLAYRYALDRLNPFVLLTDVAIYDQHNRSHELDRLTEDSPDGRMTDEYLRDRAAFLYWKAKLDAYNKVAVEHDGAFDLAYEDLGTGTSVDLIGKSQGPAAEHRFVRFAAKQGSLVLGGSSTDALFGSEGGDRIEAATGADYLEGGWGADKLFGGGGEDLLVGGDADDELTGGADNDVLIGGAGVDTYVINSGDGTDTVRDTGDNLVRWNGRLIAGIFEKTSDADSYRFLSSDPAFTNLTLTFNSPATLADGTGAALVFENYESPEAFGDGDFGITLFSGERPDPVIERTRVGSEDGDFFEDVGPEPDFIDAKGGPDHIETAGGGDYIDAGEGDDQVFSDLNWHDPGDDVVIGGGGSDILVSDGGNDRLYGDHRAGLAEAIADVSATTSPLKGDWLAGGEGDDALIGSASSDVFAGGGGEDILVGGAGNDFLMGDADYRPVRNWEFSVRADGRPGPFTTGLPEEGNPVSSAADAIYGGSGDDWAWAGRGDDTIDGGPGRDLLLGGLGSDMIVGGDGDDTLAAGDMNRLDLTDSGGDYLDGGPGNDTLYGSAGDTMLFGGEGDDRIFAGPGADFIDAGPGNDRISSSGGADFIDGGDGDDVVTASFFSTDGVSIHGGEGADTLRSGLGEDALFGGAGDDVLTGDEASDLLDGGTGNDRYFVKPGSGADEISDEFGDDVLEIESLEGIAPERAVSREGIRLADGEDGRFSLFYGILGDRIDLGAEPLGVIERIEIKHYWTGVDFTLEVIEFSELWDAYLVATLPPNSAPDLTRPLPSATTLEDEPFGYTLPGDTFFDLDPDDVLSYSASLAGGAALPAWLTFDPVTATFSGVPTNTDVGSLEVIITATDLLGASASAGFVVSVANTNDAPQVSGSIGPQAVEEESRFDLVLPADLFVDEDDGDELSWSARVANGTALPDWLVFDPVAKTLSGTPTRAAVGEWSIALSVSDGVDATASLAFDLSVTKAPGQTLSGGDGSEVLRGGSGDDTLLGTIGADALIGGKGDDTFVLAADGLWSPGYAAYNAGSPGSPGTGRIVGIAGKSRLFDTLDGGDGLDTVQGTTNHDAVFLDDGLSPFPDVTRGRLGDVERFLMGSGNDVVDLTSFDFALGAVRIEGEDGDDLLWASAGDDALLGGAGRDELYGGAGADYLAGDAGDDSLDGAYGADVLQGGEGDDTLLDPSGGGLLDGGTGNDALTGGAAAELFAGGRGNDSLRPGGGSDVVLFNRGDGADRVAAGTGAKTFSLGGGIAYEDLALERTSNRLIVHLGGGELIEFTDWYSATANAGFRYMQVIAEAMDGFDPAGTDALRDNKFERFNFAGLVEAFDAARTANPMIARWQAMDALLDAHLAGSDDEALGGDLAYRYGLAGTFAGHGLTAARTVLQSPDLGAKPQTVTPGPSIPADPLLG